MRISSGELWISAGSPRESVRLETRSQTMSEERFSSMDEGTLRKLLEVTMDLAERKEIRTAIRELRRKELERCEEALASKRFRSEKSNEQENKENRPGADREERQKELSALALRLQSISDVEELTALLRNTGEYEERKLIRAAIRKLRSDEIEAASLGGMLISRTSARDHAKLQSKSQETAGDLASLAQEREHLEERQKIKAQIHELRSAQNSRNQTSGSKDTATDMLLLLAGPSKEKSSSSSSSTSSTSSSEHLESSPLQTPELSSTSVSSDLEEQPQKHRNDLFTESLTNKSCSIREKTSSTSTTTQKGNAKTEEKPVMKWSRNAEDHTSSRLAADNEGSFPEGVSSTSCTELDAQTSMPPFRRAFSVRDRVKRFTEDPTSTSPTLGCRFGSMRGERVPARGVQQQPSLFSVGHKNFQKALLDERVTTKPEVMLTVSGPCTRKIDESATAVTQSFNKIQSFKSPSIPELNKSKSTSLKGSSSLCSAGLCTSSREANRRFPQTQGSFILKQEGRRNHPDQLKGSQPTKERGRIVENIDGANTTSEVQSSAHHCITVTDTLEEAQDPGMKALLTIEIKDGRTQATNSRIVGQPGSQRAELTLGLTSSPFQIASGVSSSSVGTGSGNITSRTTTHSGISSSKNVHKVESEVSQQPFQQVEVFLPSTTEKAEPECKGKLTAQDLSAIEEEEVLDKMLDQTTDFEERRMIRTAMRDLRQRKREQREKEREQRLQELKNKERDSKLARTTETSVRQSETTNLGSAVSTVTKTQRLVKSNDGSKTSSTTVEASYMKRSENGGTIVQTKSSFSATSKKVGSVFDREDEGNSKTSITSMERLQADRKKELMKAPSLPKTPATQARKAMIEKMEKESGSQSSPAFAKVATPRAANFGVPNANSIKQMLLDWCKSKTRGYEYVNIQNFSSSWSDGMAFCALVHNFFPEAFDYNQLIPQNRRQNFDLAFSAAEKHADCPQLLDAEDMVRMREPDWKCVYTYIQEFYRSLVQKGMVKTKKC
ncbi:hypothetical protein GDO86_001706 [Hymenochirus boettgeri]|uniref:Calponin-homology (CH) domain-containing protein n=1 Tax=Hymenochirus boettgeri TaxID=247094 RepID=A0A8T2KDT3_9PIPI|nr:hypothetical protein GDO86_001706 [Hymenochirus boettgeri]